MLESLPILLLVAGRLAGLVVFAPVFAGPGVPMRLRLFLLIGLAATLGPMLAARDAALLSPVADAALLPLLGREVVLGLIIGFAASLPFLGARMGGILMGQQMGLGIAALFDPGADEQSQIIGRLLLVDTVNLVNLVSETRTIPEFIGKDCRPEPIAEALLQVLDAPEAQSEAMALTMERLGRDGPHPGDRAAQAVLEGLGQD